MCIYRTTEEREEARLLKEMEEERKLCNTDLARAMRTFNQELNIRRDKAATIPDSFTRITEETKLDEVFSEFRAEQKTKKVKIEEDLQARHARGLKYAKLNTTAARTGLTENLVERAKVNSKIRTEIAEHVTKLGGASKTVQKLNFADFVAVMSGKETSIQRQLNQQVVRCHHQQVFHLVT